MSREEVQSDLQIPWKDERQRDLVEVVRCKDCKYCDSYIAEITSDGNMERIEYRCKDFHASVMPDEYCSRGERRDG